MNTEQVMARAGLAGATALAAGTGAYGAIVTFTGPTDLPNVAATGTAGPISFDVNGDGTNDFTYSFRNPQTATGSGVVWQAQFNRTAAATNNAVLGFQGPFIPYATNLGTGVVLGPTTPVGASWRNQAQVVLGSIYRSNGVAAPYGGFVTGGQNTGSGGRPAQGRGFLGFQFDAGGGQIRYGWLDVEVRPATSAANTGGIFFFGGAYENTGASIQSGAVPAPGAIGALALGAAGLLRRSRREK